MISSSSQGKAFPPADRCVFFASIEHSPAVALAKAKQIHEDVLARSGHIRTANFNSIAVADLRLLFDLYDAHFFAGNLRSVLREENAGEVAFRLSNRMTNAAGKTFRQQHRHVAGGPPARVEYEIAISSFLLFQSFREPGKPVPVTGVLCHNRLEALQRIFEHELLHLVEFLLWGASSCSGANFHALSRRIFAHESSQHELVTQRQVAAETYQVRPGDRVRFEHEGRKHVGVLNRITKRATVLVEDAEGPLFSNGLRYTTFYVPLALLSKEEAPEPPPD